MMLLLQLFVQFVGIAAVEVYESGLGSTFLNLPEAAAGCLQYHVFRTIALLREYDAGQASAVPSLLADLDKQYNAYL